MNDIKNFDDRHVYVFVKPHRRFWVIYFTQNSHNVGVDAFGKHIELRVKQPVEKQRKQGSGLFFVSASVDGFEETRQRINGDDDGSDAKMYAQRIQKHFGSTAGVIQTIIAKETNAYFFATLLR